MATISELNNESNVGAPKVAQSTSNANTMPMRHFLEVGGLLFVREHQHRLASKREVLLHRTMLTACIKGLPKLARRALKHGLNPLNRMYGKDGQCWRSYIHHAAARGSFQVLKLLVEAGVPVDILESEGYTPLSCAVTFNHSHIVQYLLGKGAEINICDAVGVPLFVQACTGYLNEQGEHSCSPSIAIVHVLLKAGADAYQQYDHPTVGLSTAIKLAKLEKRHPESDIAAFDIVIAMLEKAMTFNVTEDAIEIPVAELRCSICHDVSEKKDWCHVACCNSQFHVDCIAHWLECSIHKDCPLCRGQTRNARKVVPNKYIK